MERAVLLFGAAAVGLWLAGGCGMVLSGRGWHEVPPSAAAGLLVGVLDHPSDPGLAWPLRLRSDLPPPGALWVIWAALMTLSVVTVAAVFRRARRGRRRRPRQRSTDGAAVWARQSDLAALTVRASGGNRLVVGRCGRSLLAVERGQSLLVVGPTQSGKTTGIAIPALVEWDGPVVATSVKTDLVDAAITAGRRRGPVLVYDPLRISRHQPARWSPLAESITWAGAKRVAAGLCAAQRESGRSPEDAAFWGALAEKLLAPMLLAAAAQGATMSDVVAWVDTGDAAAVLGALEGIDADEALRAAQASFSREERQLSSVFATAEAAVAAFADPVIAASAETSDIDVAAVLDSGASLFLVAPAHEQERLRPVFVALLRGVLDEAFVRAARQGRLDPPLLVVLDEAANVAPLSNLDALASTASGHGIQLLTVWQDFAQIEARYGTRSATVINNHRAKLIFPGISDPATLDWASRLIGDSRDEVESLTLDRQGVASTTVGESERRLAPAASIRTVGAGEAVLLYGSLPPARITIRASGR